MPTSNLSIRLRSEPGCARRRAVGAPLAATLVLAAMAVLVTLMIGGVTAAIGAVAQHTSLHLRHPLVLAAVADARSATDGRERIGIRVPADAPSELSSTRGKRGRLRVVKLTFDGFERVERLVPVVVLDDVAEPLPPATAEALLRSELRDVEPGTGRGSPISPDDMDDACDALLIGVQQDIDGAEQQRFERAAFQARRFIEDRILVQRRRRADLLRQLEEAQARRDAATGSEARADAENRVVQIDVKVAEVDAVIERLDRRDNETFQRFNEHIHKRRYSPPTVEHLFEMELVIE